MPDTVGELRVQELERCEIRWDLWTPARIAKPRATVDCELTVRGELMALSWSLYTPEPFGTVEDVTTEGLGRILDSLLQR